MEQEALILQAKAGDESALLMLYHEYYPLIFKMKHLYHLHGFDQQDWLQEGLIVFHRCIREYNPNQGSAFGALFKRSFENHLRSLVRKQCAYKRKSDYTAISLTQEMICEKMDTQYDVRPLYSNPLETILMKEALFESTQTLSSLEKKALYTFTLGKPQDEEPQDPSFNRAYYRSKQKIIAGFSED